MPAPNIDAVLHQHGIKLLDQDVRALSGDELKGLFGAASSGRVIMTKLMRSIVWHVHTRTQAGELEPSGGNLRTFWYRWVKPTLSHIPGALDTRTDPYDTMLAAFEFMIMDLGLCRYRDFDFTDSNWENRRIGTTRPHVLLFAEKAGWIRLLRRFHSKHGVCVLATGGAPSALTSEYTASDIRPLLPSDTKGLHLIGIVDYDPAGAHIAQAQARQLRSCGMTISTLSTVIDPKHYSVQELEMFKFPLPKRQKTKNKNWLRSTGGIDGQLYGLESESMPLKRLRRLLTDKINQAPEL